MHAQAAGVLMADTDPKNVTFQMRCPRAWIERVTQAAEALNISAASYIRLVVTQRMDSDNVPPPKKPKR